MDWIDSTYEECKPVTLLSCFKCFLQFFHRFFRCPDDVWLCFDEVSPQTRQDGEEFVTDWLPVMLRYSGWLSCPCRRWNTHEHLPLQKSRMWTQLLFSTALPSGQCSDQTSRKSWSVVVPERSCNVNNSDSRIGNGDKLHCPSRGGTFCTVETSTLPLLGTFQQNPHHGRAHLKAKRKDGSLFRLIGNSGQ